MGRLIQPKLRTRQSKFCSVCKEQFPISNFYPRSDRPGLHHSACKKCHHTRSLEWHKTHTREVTPRKRILWRKAALKTQYGLSLEKYKAAIKKLNSTCFICQQKVSELVVDHNHKTNELRGLLCRKCNAALGSFSDDPENLIRALYYLINNGKIYC